LFPKISKLFAFIPETRPAH